MSMPYSRLPAEVWKKIGINAGVLLRRFDPAENAVSRGDIIGATTGTITFNARPSFEDLGAGVNNCPKNAMELLMMDDWEVRLSGTFISADTEATRRLIALADADGSRVTPRGTVDLLRDFGDIWYVFDYGDVHSGDNPGRYVIHMRNALSTGGFQVQTDDREKAKWPFEFTAHGSLQAAEQAPFEVFVVEGVRSN